MIKSVRRDVLRMTSGAVHVIDPLEEVEQDAMDGALLAEFRRLNPFFRDLPTGYVIVNAYDRIDSVLAKTVTVVALAHIESVSVVDVQIEDVE
jgi:hypothetical protein